MSMVVCHWLRLCAMASTFTLTVQVYITCLTVNNRVELMFINQIKEILDNS